MYFQQQNLTSLITRRITANNNAQRNIPQKGTNVIIVNIKGIHVTTQPKHTVNYFVYSYGTN